MTQARDSLRAAVEVLVADGHIKARLSLAYEAHLEPLTELELPSSIAESYRDLAVAMHRVAPVGRQTSVHATVQKMSSAEATSHAATILALYCDLLQQQSERAGPPLRTRRPKIVEAGSGHGLEKWEGRAGAIQRSRSNATKEGG